MDYGVKRLKEKEKEDFLFNKKWQDKSKSEIRDLKKRSPGFASLA